MSHIWNERYAEQEYVYGTKPNDFLASIDLNIFKGHVLCLAEGQGRNAVYLAKQGFEVTAVDFSAIGMERAAELAMQEKVSMRTIVADLNIFPIDKEFYNGIVSIFGHFKNDERKHIHRKAIDGLKTGGFFILEAYSKNQLKYNTGGPKDINLLYSFEEFASDFEGLLNFIILRETEREIIEGTLHHGLASVVQLFGIKK